MKLLKISQYLKESFSDIKMHYYAFDWDDNILHMPTKILMDKKEGNGWVPVEVSTAEFTIVRNDPNYRIRNNDAKEAFSEFRDSGKRGSGAFLQDTITAVRNGRKGPSWNALIECLTNASIFAIITARGHEPESIRSAVEWIIDNELSSDEKYTMYLRCGKFSYWFGPHDVDKYPKIPVGLDNKKPNEKFSSNKLVQEYLKSCSFYGVSSKSFAEEFEEASASNPEDAKKMALDEFIKKCRNWGSKIGAGSVSVGFSDDDPKNVAHIEEFFKEKTENMAPSSQELKLNIYSTVDPKIPGGKRIKFNKDVEKIIDADETMEESQSSFGMGMSTRGLDSSVLPFTGWNSMTKNLYPSSQDNPKDDFHNHFKNKIGQIGDLTKDVTKKLKKKNVKHKKVRKLRK